MMSQIVGREDLSMVSRALSGYEEPRLGDDVSDGKVTRIRIM